MATWDAISQENMESAKKLLPEGHYRKSISCSYYACYCAITSKLVNTKASFAHGWKNPGHEQLPKLIVTHLPLSIYDLHKVRKHLILLRQWREDSDYRPHKTIDKNRALEAIIYAQRIITILEERSYGSR